MLQDRRQFYEIISSFRTLDVPIILFVKALRKGSTWELDGELQDEPLEMNSMVPRCLSTLFNLGNKVPEDLQLPLARHLRFLTVRHKGGQWCLSIKPSMKRAILDDIASDESRERYLNILHIFLKAFPEEYSQILWEELRLQLDDVLSTSIIPILRVISLRDLQNYHARHEKSVQGPHFDQVANTMPGFHERLFILN
jgi:hypothetical protein